jgi:entry exclusion lipoprotein TrbK
MKYIAVLTCVLLTAIASPSFAQDDNKTCSAKAEKITNTAERTAFLKSCLAKRSSPENTAQTTQRHKEAQCDMNASNMKLAGKKKAEYLEHCYQENDFNPSQNPHPKD